MRVSIKRDNYFRYTLTLNSKSCTVLIKSDSSVVKRGCCTRFSLCKNYRNIAIKGNCLAINISTICCRKTKNTHHLGSSLRNSYITNTCSRLLFATTGTNAINITVSKSLTIYSSTNFTSCGIITSCITELALFLSIKNICSVSHLINTVVSSYCTFNGNIVMKRNIAGKSIEQYFIAVFILNVNGNIIIF